MRADEARTNAEQAAICRGDVREAIGAMLKILRRFETTPLYRIGDEIEGLIRLGEIVRDNAGWLERITRPIPGRPRSIRLITADEEEDGAVADAGEAIDRALSRDGRAPTDEEIVEAAFREAVLTAYGDDPLGCGGQS